MRVAPNDLFPGTCRRDGDKVEWQRYNMQVGLIDAAPSQAANDTTAMLEKKDLLATLAEQMSDTG